MMSTNSFPTSSPRKRGPITTALRDGRRSQPPRPNETSRGMGPGVRRDDGGGWRTELSPLVVPAKAGTHNHRPSR
jgi:hypothetical protein